MLRFYSPFFLFCFVLLVDRKLAGAHFPPDNQHHSHPASTLLSPCTFTIYLFFFVCLFYVKVHHTTPAGACYSQHHLTTFRKVLTLVLVEKGGGVQSWPLCSLCKLCPTLCHTLWIRWVIAKQPGVIEDAVVIAMGVFDRTSFTGSVSHWSPTTPPPQKKKGGLIRTRPRSCQPAAWPGPDGWFRALEVAEEKQKGYTEYSIQGWSSVECKKRVIRSGIDLWLSDLPPLVFEAVSPFAVNHPDAVEGTDD